MNILNWIYTLRSYIDSYLGFLKGTRFWSLIWVVAICVVIWFYGASIAFDTWRPLEKEFNRLVAIGVVIVGWLLYAIVSFIRKRRAEKSLINELTDAGEIDPEASARDDVAQLKSKLKEALLRMRGISKKRFNFVYDFPWYMIIGSPGSGKTTALLNSGLKFPFGDDVDGSVQGIGGTRDCDWWFTDDAILIDTAGRYTTQDSDTIVDSKGWQGFLSLLKKHRPLKPVNGIIIALSIEEVLAKSPQARIKEIRTIRQRLRDLEESMKVRLPVYLIFTKVDMVAGFSEFFDGFNKFDREQVLGTTFPLGVSQSKGKIADAFAEQYQLILERMNRLLLERMQQEPDDIRRSRVFRFPAQFAALESSIVELVAELTAVTKLTAAPLLRGVYFVSATQPGHVFDRTRAAISERFAFLPDSTASGPVGQKPFFLSRLFEEVIFGEANLVIADKRASRRRNILIGTAYAIPLLLSTGLTASWGHAWYTNKQTLLAVNNRITAYNRDVEGFSAEKVTSSDIVAVIEPLNNLRGALREDVPGTDRWYHVGIEQEPKLLTGLQESYFRGLNGLLLPRTLNFLQEGMENPEVSPQKLYVRLKLYLMLGGLGSMDVDYVREFLGAELAERLPSAARAGQRDALLEHIDVLVNSKSMKLITLDQGMIDQARETLRAKLPSVRIYEIVRALPKANALPDWRPSEGSGSGGDLLFSRNSNAAFRDGIAGVFARKGFYSVILPEVTRVARQFQSEPWVLGEDYLADQQLDDLRREVLRQYFIDHDKAWGDLLQDIRIRDVADLQQATSAVGILTSKNNPMLSLARAVAIDSDKRPGAEFDAPPPPAPTADPANAPAATEGNLIEDAKAKGEALVDTFAGAGDALKETPQVDLNLYLLDDFGPNVLAPYADLRLHVFAEGEQKAEVDNLSGMFEELFRQLSRAASNTGEVNEIFGVKSALAAATQSAVAEAQRSPAPLDRWLGTLATDVVSLSSSGARASLSQLWQTTGGRFCASAIEGRRPFVLKAENSVAIDDFTRMFGPGGEFSNFFELHLKPFVDTTQSPWQWDSLTGNEAVSGEALQQFENAQRIQSAFFNGGAGLNVTLDISPVELDADSTAVLLSLNDQSITYDHGPIQAKSLKWPGDGNRSARIAFQPPGDNASVTKTGPWAVFELFKEAKIETISEDKFRATFRLGGRSASFDVQVGSVLNPFSLPEIGKFRCPERL